MGTHPQPVRNSSLLQEEWPNTIPFIPGFQESQHKDGQHNVRVDTRVPRPGHDPLVSCHIPVNTGKRYVLMKKQRSTWPDPLHRTISVLGKQG